MSPALPDSLPCLVADASAVINLIASGAALPILESFSLPMLVTETVASELSLGSQPGRTSADQLAALVEARAIQIVALNGSAEECFESLVIGPAADTLDDGEAATIAYARAAGTAALIDEKKARRICATRFPDVSVHTTIDLLTSAHVEKVLGSSSVAEAVFSALIAGRMRVPPTDYERVLRIIGTDRARLCTSLPHHIRSAHKKLAG